MSSISYFAADQPLFFARCQRKLLRDPIILLSCLMIFEPRFKLDSSSAQIYIMF